MMTWIFLSLLAAALWAVVNYFDKYLIEKYCKGLSVGALVIFSSLIGFPVVISIALFHSGIYDISGVDILLLISTGILYILGVIPYLYALNENDVSAVVPQSLMIPVMGSVMAYFMLGESLTRNNLIGMVFILLGSICLNVDFTSLRGLKFNIKVFVLMIMASILVSFSTVLFKYMSSEADFWAMVLWMHVGFSLTGVIFLIFIKSYRSSFLSMISQNSLSIININILSEIITIVGNLSLNYATILGIVGIAQATSEGMQPVFVLIYGVLIAKFLPKISIEKHPLSTLVKRSAFIAIMIFGLIYANL